MAKEAVATTTVSVCAHSAVTCVGNTLEENCSVIFKLLSSTA